MIKVLKNFSIGFLFMGFMSSSSFATGSLTEFYSQKELLKNWALSICFAQISKDAYNKDDAGITAGAYLEYGKGPIEDYDELRKIVKKYINLKYSGSVQSNYDTMKCIDMFHSKELNNLVKKLVKNQASR